MLNTSERVTVRQAVVRLRARDVAEALALLRSVLDAPRRHRSEIYDYPRLPGLDSVFLCPKLKGHMAIEDCLVRRSRIWPSGGGKGCPRHAECQGCDTGMLNAALRPDFVPPPSTLAAEVLSPSQRTAKRIRALTGLSDDEAVRVDMDPMRAAARSTPDDEGLDYTP